MRLDTTRSYDHSVCYALFTSYSSSPVSSDLNWSHVTDLKLIDPNPISAEHIDLILGADLYSNIILDGVRKGKQG